jgi:cysteinyl-tRNA synthetase
MLQGDVAAEIDGTDFSVVVMDYTKDGTDDLEQRYAPAEMARIEGTGARRKALAYLSIGEAEDYRYYFDHDWVAAATPGGLYSWAPDWLGLGNPDWEGNYKVRYWSEEWQQLVFDYLDRLVAYGFDGAYLDIVDGFEYWSDPDNGEGFSLSETEAAERMAAFVVRIAEYARSLDEDFLVIPQNGERLLAYDPSGRYLAAIDGMGVEDLFYNERNAVDPAETAERVAHLDRVLASGKLVLVVDYVYVGSRDALVDDFRAKATAAGYSPYAACTDRELDRMVTFAGQGE